MPKRTSAAPDDPHDAMRRLIETIFDAEFYRQRYPDIAVAGIEPLPHFLHHGFAEKRDPNPFFDNAWYAEHYPDVAVSGINPLLHYMQSGAQELRNPHPRFDAAWYVEQHPDAAANPLLYHIKSGAARCYLTERTIDIASYLPSEAKPPAVPRRLVVDVIIPVYRGLEETRACLDSVLADPSPPLGRVIVVEDKSPEPALMSWLQRLARQKRIHLLRNARNLGFVQSVNAGMREAAPNDVVLLNSDTVVPPGWLSRLAAQAYAAKRIASVSPFSNNATICSYPCNEGGPVALGNDVAAVDAACRDVNAGRFVSVPTTVGFCMYIRRKALDQVGLFDAERFREGYGEENDFCLRASAAGWSHRLACDTFVYHKGSVSFGERAIRLAARATELIAETFPDYAHQVAHHVALDEVAPYRFAVTAGLFRTSGKPVVLMLSHDLGGGVRRHIDELVRRFEDQAHFLLLMATDRGAELSVPSLPGHPVLALPADRMDDLLRLLQSLAVSRVHVHHLMGMDLDVRRLIHRLGVPFDATVHDYLALCPQINLTPWRYSPYCGEPDIAGCNACIAHRSSHGARDVVTWRMERAWQLRDADRVFCPSNDTLERLRRFGLAANAIVVPHEQPPSRPWPVRVPALTGKLRIAILGTLVDHKGGRTVANLVELIDPRTTEVHLIGAVDGEFPPQALKRMKVTGRYRERDLAGLIEAAAPHVIWFPMAWPETYSYTLSAAMEAGAAIAAPAIGAFPERLEGHPLAWVVPFDTPPDGWLRVFGDIRAALAARNTPERPVRDAAPKPPAPPRPAERSDHPSAAQYIQPRTFRLSGTPLPSTPRRMRIAVVPERFDIGSPTPCAYIRLLQPLSHPAIAGDFDVVMADHETVLDQAVDIIVTQRFAVPTEAAAERLANHASRTGATLVYDLDDDLLNVPRTHPDARELRPLARIARGMLARADVVWVSTQGLARSIAPLRSDAVVIENRLDERIWAHAPPNTPTRQTPVRILAMGTTTHDRDFRLIEPALVRLKAEYRDRVTIDILGMTNQADLPPGLNRIGPSMHGTRSYAGFVDWITRVQPGWHIGLAPLLDTPFNACKSPIKAMDYAALGLAVLASDTGVYRGSIADAVAGQLVPNTAEAWYAALDLLLRDTPRRQAAAAQAREAFLATASLAADAAFRRSAWLKAGQSVRPAPASASAA